MAATISERSARQRGRLADLARGGPLGHPLHPALTDLPIGFWTSSFVLDLVGGRRSASVARSFVGLGVVSAVPTIATGIADLPTLSQEKRRVAVVHAVANVTATVLYVASWRTRRHSRAAGVTVGLVAAAAATVGGYLGGWLAFGTDPRERSTARSHVA